MTVSVTNVGAGESSDDVHETYSGLGAAASRPGRLAALRIGRPREGETRRRGC